VSSPSSQKSALGNKFKKHDKSWEHGFCCVHACNSTSGLPVTRHLEPWQHAPCRTQISTSAFHMYIEHASLNIAVPLNLHEQTIFAGLGKSVGERYFSGHRVHSHLIHRSLIDRTTRH
jgi:hypothetical protein